MASGGAFDSPPLHLIAVDIETHKRLQFHHRLHQRAEALAIAPSVRQVAVREAQFVEAFRSTIGKLLEGSCDGCSSLGVESVAIEDKSRQLGGGQGGGEGGDAVAPPAAEAATVDAAQIIVGEIERGKRTPPQRFTQRSHPVVIELARTKRVDPADVISRKLERDEACVAC